MAKTGRTRERAQELLRGRQLIFSLNYGQASRFEPGAFRRFVEFAADFGATHIHVGTLPFRYNSWVLPDNTDPYASWCNTAPGSQREPTTQSASSIRWIRLCKARGGVAPSAST